MTPLETLAEWRSQVADEDTPYLWSDDQAFRYLIDAQDKFVEWTGGILDSTTAALTDLALIANSPWAAFSPYVLRFLDRGRLLTAKRDVKFASKSDIEQIKVRDYGQWMPLSFDDADVGEVMYAITGLDENKVRLVRVPAVNDTLRTTVYRLPFPRIADWDDPLEIPEENHLDLILWMKHRAYGKHDAETYDKALAKESKEDFKAICEDVRAKKERRQHKPRVVKYGGL